MRIVLVDDNPDDRLLAIRVLRAEFPQADFVEVFDAQALENALSPAPNLMVTDYALRWTTGVDVLDIAQKRLPSVPVIMFTNTGSEEIAARALRHGAADYVIKRHGEFNRLATAAKNAITQAQLRSRVDVLLQEERAARLEAERASRLREEFLATLSHELRTPLQAILGWMHLIQKGGVKGAQLQKAYETVVRNARAQARLIDDLIDLSRIAAGKLVFDMNMVALEGLVKEVQQELRPLAQSKSVQLSAYDDQYGGVVRGDAERLCQVLRNIISNAIKFSDAGGRIEVGSRRVGPQVEISVSDQGIGIAPDVLPRIFERFQQADASTTRRTGGMGIGLSIAKHIVEAHGGRISAHSGGLGKGATFIVTLPVPETVDLAARTGAGRPPPSLRGLKILLVDDDADSLAMMRIALKQAGAEVHVALTTREALELLEGHAPDIVVSDISMPTEDGYALIRTIRQRDAPLSALPALALTAFAQPEHRQKALLAGFNGHLGKPVDIDQLIRGVAELVGRGEAA